MKAGSHDVGNPGPDFAITTRSLLLGAAFRSGPVGALFFLTRGTTLASPLYYAGFVDAGFLKAEGVKALRVGRDRRARLVASEVVHWFRVAFHHQYLTGDYSFLRAYWYDGAFDPQDERYRTQRVYFDAIASTPGVQIRLGHVAERTPSWQNAVRRAVEKCGVTQADFEAHFTFRPELFQKGVDSRIVLDLVRLAERGVYDTAVLIAGDRDLAEAVRAAQDAGCRVLVAFPEGAGVAVELRQLADELIMIPKPHLEKMVVAGEAPSAQ